MTVVENATLLDLVVEAVDDNGNTVRYYALPAGARVPVDSTGHVNPPPSSIAFFDRSCTQVAGFQRVMDLDGGVLTLTPDMTISYIPGFRMSGQDPESRGFFDSCAEAAVALP
jgi:hypothetical protein